MTISAAIRDEAQAKAFDAFLSTMGRQFPGEVTTLSGSGLLMQVPAISTGAISLDVALGVGGLPRGRIVELYGPESSGKTSLALSTAARAIAAGGAVGFVDAEHALSMSHALAHGVDPDRLVVFQPNSGEQGLQMAEKMCASKAFDIVIVDSVAALTPQAEIDGEIGDQFVGLQARMMSQAMRKLAAVASSTDTMLIFINQIREKIGGYGNPEDTPGGRALKFYASVRMEVRSPAGNRIKGKVDGIETPIGQTCKVTVKKNKVSVPFKTAEYDLYYDSGIQGAASIFDAALATGAITKASAVTYVEAATGEQITTGGAPGAKAKIAEDLELQARLTAAILASLEPVEPDFDDDGSIAELDAGPDFDVDAA